MSKIYVLHENDAWIEPLRAAFEARGLPYEAWFLDEGEIDLAAAPPQGVFYNRMSASSHTRGHRYAPEYTAAVLAWLEAHGRRVVNSSRALRLEISKAAQYAALHAHGIRTPRTVLAVGRERLLRAAQAFAPGPVILKPNRGGKGLGVQLFNSVETLRDHVAGAAWEPPLDGIALLQEYVRSPDASITRAEFIGGEFHYAVRVDASRGFELCPADACAVGDAFCPVGEGEAAAPTLPAAPITPAAPQRPQFEIREGFQHPVLAAYRRFLAANDIEVAGIEFLSDAQGEVYTYDVNTNTNYNPDAEARAGRIAPGSGTGMGRVADFLGAELARLRDRSRQRASA
jgi:hypothetical protein